MGLEIPPASWAAEGQAMRRAVAGDFAEIDEPATRVVVTLDSRLDDDPGPWTIAPIEAGNHSARLIELAGQADYTVLIAPETSGTLSALIRKLEATGARTIGCSADAVELAGNKPRLGDWLRERGVATPLCRAIVPAEGLPGDFLYPAVLKPIDGAGSVDTYWISDRDSLPSAARAMAAGMLQPFHDGTPMSASFLVAADQRAWLIALGRMRVTVHQGRFVYQGGVLPVRCPDALSRLYEAISSVPGLRGFVGVDFLWDRRRGEATILEINPRVTTSYVGLSRVLPTGCLASAWLAACGAIESSSSAARDLAGLVDRRVPVRFDTRGDVRPMEQGELRA